MEDSIEAQLKRADEYLTQGKHRQAMAIYASLVACDADTYHYRACVGYAKTALMLRQYRMVVDIAELNLVRYPNDQKLLILRAGALAVQREFASAALIYEQVLQENPNEFTALLAYGWLLNETKKYLKAQGLLQRAMKLNNSNELVWSTLSCSLARQQGKAIQSLRTAWQMTKRFGLLKSFVTLNSVFFIIAPVLAWGLMIGLYYFAYIFESSLSLVPFGLYTIWMGLVTYGVWRGRERVRFLVLLICLILATLGYLDQHYGLLSRTPEKNFRLPTRVTKVDRHNLSLVAVYFPESTFATSA